MSDEYATLTDFSAYTDIDSTSALDDVVIENILEGASRYIDAQTGRTFYARTETRYYDVPGGRELKVDDDLLAITTLTNGNDSTIAATHYHLLPKNESPKYAIKLRSTSTIAWEPNSEGDYEYVISVAGSWGYASEIPADIKQACLEIARSAYGRRHGRSIDGVARVTAAGVVITPRDITPYAMAIIARYRKMT